MKLRDEHHSRIYAVVHLGTVHRTHLVARKPSEVYYIPFLSTRSSLCSTRTSKQMDDPPAEPAAPVVPVAHVPRVRETLAHVLLPDVHTCTQASNELVRT